MSVSGLMLLMALTVVKAQASPRLSLILGRPTDRSVTVNLLANRPIEGYFEYGSLPGRYDARSTAQIVLADVPM